MRVASALGIARSLAMYYGQPWRRRRMDELYGQFMGSGDVAFDIGAHVGNRIGSWLRCGARVVAVEPNPDCFQVLGRFYGAHPGVVLHPCGVAESTGVRTMRVSSRTPTVSTLSDDWIEDVTADPRFSGIDWDQRLEIPTVTLDLLIGRHGEPRFCKIDVEGSELAVLQGLSTPLASLSFEYIPIARDRALDCIDRLGELGDYRYRVSKKETMRWATDWLETEAVRDYLWKLPTLDPSGDVYAQRRD